MKTKFATGKVTGVYILKPHSICLVLLAHALSKLHLGIKAGGPPSSCGVDLFIELTRDIRHIEVFDHASRRIDFE